MGGRVQVLPLQQRAPAASAQPHGSLQVWDKSQSENDIAKLLKAPAPLVWESEQSPSSCH